MPSLDAPPPDLVLHPDLKVIATRSGVVFERPGGSGVLIERADVAEVIAFLRGAHQIYYP